MKLVAPVYTLAPLQERVLEFKGLNKKSVIDDGEMRDMYNLSSDEYPCLYQRKPRGVFSESYQRPTAMIVKGGKLAVISDGKFYYDGKMEPGLSLSDKTQMVSINTRICFFPEKMFYNIKTEETGSLPAKIEMETECSVSSSTITFKSATIDDKSFAKGDALDIYIEGWSESGGPFQTSAIIEDIGKTYIKFPDDTFIGVIAEGKTSIEIASGIVRFERKCPDLDFVVESNNRLWGVSNADNTIYACKLGDPTNWAYFQNTSLDSYSAPQGTDGEWTGCAAYSSHLLFFKEDYIHRLYGSRPSEFQTDTMECHGLEKGSEKSIAIINDVVMYKARVGIMAYSGGTPVLISDSFGTGKYKDAVAGTDRFKYYVSLINDGTPEFYVYDMSRYLWHKEDNARARAFAYLNGKLLFIDDVSNSIYQIDSSSGSNEIEWMAQLGPFDEFVEDKKIYSKLKLRLNFEELSELKLSISIDDGEWELIGNVNTRQGRTLTVPIVPRRCNRFAIKLEGKGYCKIESIVRQYRQGRR